MFKFLFLILFFFFVVFMMIDGSIFLDIFKVLFCEYIMIGSL